MNRLFLAASVGALCVTALAAHATAAGQGTTAPPAKSADQERYEAELRRYQAEQERYQKGVREAEAARERYERASARHQRQVEQRNEEEAEDQQRRDRRAAEEAEEAAERRQRQERRAAEEAEEAAERQQRQERRQARAAGRDGRAPEAATVSGASNAPTVASAGNDCERRGQRNRRRGRTAGGILGGIARTFTPIGGVAGMVTGVLPVGELLGEAIAGLLDCDEQQKAATATEEAVRGGVGTTATWTSETRPGVTGASTVVAAERTADGGDCMTVTDVVIVDGEETRAPKRLCRVPPSSRYVRV